MLSMVGRIAIDCIAPFASRPSFMYWVCRVFTRSIAVFSIVENSAPKLLPKVLV